MPRVIRSVMYRVVGPLLGHVFAGVFYLALASGCAWVAGAYLREYVARRAAVLAAQTR